MEEERDDYRNLINERFTSIHTAIDLQFVNVNEKLNHIQSSVNAVNSRVTILENSDKQHYNNCQLAQKISTRLDVVEKNLEEYNFFKKYPKIGITILVMSVLIVLFSYREYVSSNVNATNIKLNTEQLEKFNEIIKKYEIKSINQK